jgi:hypothetical protein
VQGPFKHGTILTRNTSELNGRLVQGARYRVIRRFQDADGTLHPTGEEWMFVGGIFSKFDDEMTLCIQKSDGNDWKIPLSWRIEEQKSVLEHPQEYLEQRFLELDQAAYQLANEIRDGKWNHVTDARIEQPAANPGIIEQLRKRCPGYTVQQYQNAISKGMFDSLW